MPGTHSPISRHLFTLDGSVRTSGGAKNLAKGQFTIVDSAKAGANGAVVVSNFTGQPDEVVYEMRLGNHKIPNSRTLANSKPKSSHLFTIKDVVNVKVNAPKYMEQKFDDILVGYDGINEATALTFEENSTTVLDVVLSGDHLGFQTGEKERLIKIHFGKQEGETDQEVVRRAVKTLQEQTLLGSIPVTDLVDIKIVDSTNPELTGSAYVFSTLTLTDEGDSNALARVQAQYPLYEVKLTSRNGLASEYTILHPAGVSLAAYSQTLAAYLKGCEDCAANYDLIAGGVVYSVKIEDDGTDLTTTVDNLPGFVTGTVIKRGQDGGFGTYTLILDNDLTDAEIATYVGTAGAQATAQISRIGLVSSVCYNDATTTTAWVDGDTCYATVQSYTIQLKDDDCDGSRLAELQAAYPNLTIEAGASAGNATQTVTITGTSGTGNITVGGEDYLATYATSPTVTATNFVTDHAAAILAATGVVVTSAGAVITFAGEEEDFPVSFTNLTLTLGGTVSAIDFVTVASTGGCQRVYSTQVVTNIVCDECDPMFLQQFSSEPPMDFDFTSWEPVLEASDEDALMGIRIIGKPFIFYPGEAMRDEVPFYETSTRIKVAGGYVEEVNNSFDPIYNVPFSVKRLSRAQDRDNLGGHLMGWEDASMAYFDGESRHKSNLYAKSVFGEESVLAYDQQYVQVSVTIHDSKYSQGVGKRSDIGITYSIWAPVGKHQALVNYISALAGRAGLPAVQATPTLA